MNAVMTIKREYEEAQAQKFDQELQAAFFGMFHTPEIKARRRDRMKRDANQGQWNAVREERVRAEAREEARKDYDRRERAIAKAHQKEVADMGASVAGGLTMAASFIALAMMV